MDGFFLTIQYQELFNERRPWYYFHQGKNIINKKNLLIFFDLNAYLVDKLENLTLI